MKDYKSPEIQEYGSVESVTEWGFGFWFDWDDFGDDDEMQVSPKRRHGRW